MPDIVLDLAVVLAQLDPRFRAAFNRYLAEVEAEVAQQEIARYIASNNIKSLLRVLRGYMSTFIDVIASAFADAGEAAVESVGDALTVAQTAGTRLVFEPGNPTAASLLRNEQLRFIREINTSQRDLIRGVLNQQLREGSNPLEAAREIKRFIGLTTNQQQWVRNYQRALEQGSTNALDRALRDKRFDRTVGRAIVDGEPLSADQIERMVGRYTQRMIDYRAKTIARTESLRTMAIARRAGWLQSLNRLGVDPDKVVRTWVHTFAGKGAREDHIEMDGQEVVGLDEPYELPSGEEIMYPHDPDAPAEETINCHCNETMLIPGSELIP